MVQYNYFDENVQASVEGIEYAASKGMGIFVMEPLKGGILAGKMPEDAEKIFKDANPNKSNAEWAFQWVLNNRNVTFKRLYSKAITRNAWLVKGIKFPVSG